jgi:hypothetical protein
MRQVSLIAISVLVISVLSWGSVTRATPDESANACRPAEAWSADAFTLTTLEPTESNLDGIGSFDYAKCIESCDKQYADCAKGGDASRIKYCSDQHDKCRKACLEHK